MKQCSRQSTTAAWRSRFSRSSLAYSQPQPSPPHRGLGGTKSCPAGGVLPVPEWACVPAGRRVWVGVSMRRTCSFAVLLDLTLSLTRPIIIIPQLTLPQIIYPGVIVWASEVGSWGPGGLHDLGFPQPSGRSGLLFFRKFSEVSWGPLAFGGGGLW